MVLDFREGAPELLRGDNLADVFNRNLSGELFRIADFVIFGTVVETYREGLVHIGGTGHITGIYAGGKEGTNLHVAYLMRFHTVIEGLFNFIHPVFQCFVFLRPEFRNPIPGQTHLTVLIEKVVGGGHFIYVLEKGFKARRVLEGEIAFQGALVELFFKMGMVQKALDL